MPTLLVMWVWFCAYLNCAGWALSAMHQLNAGGYAVVLLLWVRRAIRSGSKKLRRQFFPPICWHKFRRRFRRPFPMAFLILSALAFLGGVLYAPSNYDALAYRIPRRVHWLAEDQWHWIHTILPRLNNRSCGIEWVSAPFWHCEDRPAVISDQIVSFLLLPGLMFGVFTRLGVRLGVAWHLDVARADGLRLGSASRKHRK